MSFVSGSKKQMFNDDLEIPLKESRDDGDRETVADVKDVESQTLAISLENTFRACCWPRTFCCQVTIWLSSLELWTRGPATVLERRTP